MQLSTRILAILAGNPNRDPGAKIKYGHFLEALNHAFTVVDVFDARLQGMERWRNAISVIDPDPRRWRERFHKNVSSFHQRSRLANTHAGKYSEGADVILQIGVLFNALNGKHSIPGIIYTDYTSRMSSRKMEAGRSPFTEQERNVWFELEQEAYHAAKHICVRGGFVRDSLIIDYHIDPSKISVVGGGLNLTVLPEVQLRPDTDAPTILFIGKDMYRKGGDILLEAFAEARCEFPKARLLLLTADKIAPEFPMDGVEIIQPTWDRSRIQNLYRQADIFVLPSRLETWGDVLLEAMAYCLPCIGVSGEAMEEIIEQNRTGFVVPPADVATLHAGLATLMESWRLRTQFGNAGRQRLEEQFLWSSVIDRMSDPLLNAAGANVPPRIYHEARSAQSV